MCCINIFKILLLVFVCDNFKIYKSDPLPPPCLSFLKVAIIFRTVDIVIPVFNFDSFYFYLATSQCGCPCVYDIFIYYFLNNKLFSIASAILFHSGQLVLLDIQIF